VRWTDSIPCKAALEKCTPKHRGKCTVHCAPSKYIACNDTGEVGATGAAKRGMACAHWLAAC